MMMPFPLSREPHQRPASTDSWSGYADACARVIDSICDKRLINVVVATSDVHKHHVGVVPLREGDPDAQALATEYVATSISLLPHCRER